MYNVSFREAALKVYSFLKSMRKTALALGVSVASISRWVRRLLPKQYSRQEMKTSDVLVCFVGRFVIANPACTCSQIVTEIKRSLSVDVSRQLIYNILVNRLDFSYKRTRKRGTSPRKLEATILFQKAFQEHRLQNARFCSIDESGFDQREVSVYGYSPKGKPAIVQYAPCFSRKRTSIVMCIDDSGKVQHMKTTSRVDSNTFARFVRSLDLPIGTVVLLDNASIHKTKEVMVAFESMGLKSLFIPPYSPEFNPIENIFGVMKKRFYKMRYSDITFDVDRSIDKCISSLQPDGIIKTFNHMFLQIEK